MLAFGCASLVAGLARAEEVPKLEPVQVTGHYDNTVGSTDAASAGVITPQLIEDRPLLRPGNILEYVPGMVVTQHSGAGKANQYFLRGFNLDHGTDFATWVAGMPVNLRTHGHGQGYTDLNFLIPELIARVDYWKGPYYANIGDFSSAGGAYMHYFDNMKDGIAIGTGGDYGYARALLAGSTPAGPGIVTYGLEYLHNDGPWEVPDNFRKANAVLRYVVPVGEGTFGVTGMAYSGKWNSTDQVPLRAINDGLIGRYGSLDDSDGGSSQRYSVSADYATPLAGGLVSDHRLLVQVPAESLLQLHLLPRRPGQRRPVRAGRRPQRLRLDRQLEEDRGDVRRPHAQHARLRAAAGPDQPGRPVLDLPPRPTVHDARGRRGRGQCGHLRGERHAVEQTGFARSSACATTGIASMSNSSVAENSGNQTAGIVSPKASFVFGPWYKTEYFLNAGYGFHSNDARGVTIRVDPKTGEPVDAATPLVRSKGAEVGARTEAIPGLQSSVALWYLTLGSELVFVGDAGTTEAGRPSRRYGVEWNNRWRPLPWLFVDLDVAWNKARFSDSAPEGNFIPGAPDTVISAGVAVDRYGPWSGAVFMRYIGAYPLIENNSVRSDASTVFDAQIGYAIAPKTKLRLDVFNLFNAQTNDISYFYTSRLPGEPPEGVDDTHVHPGEKRSFRLTLSYNF